MYGTRINETVQLLLHQFTQLSNQLLNTWKFFEIIRLEEFNIIDKMDSIMPVEFSRRERGIGVTS